MNTIGYDILIFDIASRFFTFWAIKSLSGGDDDSHGNQTYMEETFNAGEAQWEITRYADVVHGFTDYYLQDAYNLEADARSWESMHSAFEELMAVPVKTGEDVVVGEAVVDWNKLSRRRRNAE